MGGLICLHTVRKGQFIRSINIESRSVDLVFASSPGYLLAHSWSDLSLHLFWINGQPLAKTTVSHRIECVAVNGPGNIIVCGHSNGHLSLRELWSLEELAVYNLSSHGAINCLWFSEDYQDLLLGSLDGSFSILTDPEAKKDRIKKAIAQSPLFM